MTIDKSYLISFSILNCIVNVDVASVYLREILLKVYGCMQIPLSDKEACLEYKITEIEGGVIQFVISRADCSDMVTDDLGEFVFFFEKDMTIELQKVRSDLLFIHSAVLSYKDQGLMLVAPSGTGKSTTSWAMLNSGFDYLSDELAPINLSSMQVLSYPHALCLKAVPPLFKLPEDALDTGHTIHIPIQSAGKKHLNEPVDLKYIFFLEFDKGLIDPVITPLSVAHSSAALFANSLNILAHDNGDMGIKSAISVASQVKSYSLKSNHLDKTCQKIKHLISASKG